MPDSGGDESFAAVLISFVIAAFGGLLAHSNVCAEQHTCLHHETCYSESSTSCSFRTSVTPAGWRMLNQSADLDQLQSLNRGVCAPGMRQSVDEHDDLRCVRQLSYPNAMNSEIQDPSGGTDHARYCGKWIDAGSVAYGVHKWAFFDEAATEDAIDELVRVKGSSRLAMNDVAKFRSSCRIMVSSNSAGAAASGAFKHLALGIETPTLTRALESIGYLASHYCDAPAQVGIGWSSSNQFALRAMEGVVHADEPLKTALYAVGEPSALREAAAGFAARMAAYDAATLGATTDAQAAAVVRGAHVGTYVDGYRGPNFLTATATANPSLARFAKAHEDVGATGALAYLRGVSAVCALAASSVVVPEASTTVLRARSAVVRQRSAAALGRYQTDEADRFEPLRMEELTNASKLTLSSLSVSYAPRQTAWSVCLAASKRVFPDAFDKMAFDALVSPLMYARLRDISEAIREAAATTLSDDLIGDIFGSIGDRNAAVAKLRATPLRIAGAPRGSWAGIQREFRRPSLASDDGALVMLLKQARALFLDRLVPAVTQASLCEHPPLFAGTARNAYLLLLPTEACSVLMPGLIVPPFAGERFDDRSLYERLGFVISHEFMHVTADSNQWNPAYEMQLLGAYAASVRVEAIADVGAVATLMRFSHASNESICGAISQLFCGRLGTMDGGGYSNKRSHPMANVRGDLACDFLRAHFSQ
jgi:hypothetical protein